MNKPTSRKRIRSLSTITIAAALLVPAALPAQAAETSTVQDKGAKPTVVLVHGAWADGSSWGAVTAQLQADGYTVRVPANPLRGLSSDAAYLSAYLAQATTGPVILVGHSYGGAVITNAALSDPDVTGLVYIDAFAPAEGESVGQIVAGSESALNVEPATVFDIYGYPDAPTGDGDVYLKPATFADDFAQDVPKKLRDVLSATQKPVTYGALSEPSGVPAWKTIRSWYLVGTNDKVIPAATQISMAKRAGSSISKVDSSHLPLVSNPSSVVNVIETAAKAK